MIMTLSSILNEKASLTSELKSARESFTKKEKEIKAKLFELERQESLLLIEVNIDKVAVAESLLFIRGNPSNVCEGSIITELAANDIARGCTHLSTEFYGNKRYDGYYQRCDCQYGYGPKHGSIVEAVGLRDSTKVLSEEEKEACIYYLKNYSKIYVACAEQKKKSESYSF